MIKMKRRVLAAMLALVMCLGVLGDNTYTLATGLSEHETEACMEQLQETEITSYNNEYNDSNRETSVLMESGEQAVSVQKSESDGSEEKVTEADKAESRGKATGKASETQTSASGKETSGTEGTGKESETDVTEKNTDEQKADSGEPSGSETSSENGKESASMEAEKETASEYTSSESEDSGDIFEEPVKLSSDYATAMKLESLDDDPVPLDEEQIYNLEYNNYDIPINYTEEDTVFAKNIYVAYCSVSSDNFRSNDITYLEEMMDPANDELFGTRRSMGYGSLYDLGELNGYYAVYTGASRKNSRDVDGYALYALVDGNIVELSGTVFDANTDLLLIPYEVYEKYADHNLFVTMVQIREGSRQSSGDAFYTGRDSNTITLAASPGSTVEAQYSFTTNSNDKTMYWGGSFINPKTGDEVGGEGSYLYRYKAKSEDGTLMKITFCLEPGAHLFTGDQLSDSQGHIKWNKLSTEQKDAIRYIIYKYAHHSLDTDCNNDEKWAACQALIWEIAMEIRDPETFVRSGARVYNNYLSHSTAANARAAYDEMASHIRTYADRIKTTTYDGEFDFYATASRQMIFAGTSIKTEKAGISFEITKKTENDSASKALVNASSKYSLKGAEYSAYEIPDVESIADAKSKGFTGRDKSDPSSASTNSSGIASLTLPSILDKDHPRAAYIIYETASSPYYRLDRTIYLLYLYYNNSENKVTYRLYSIPWSERKTAASSDWTSYKDATTISTTATPKTTVYETPKSFKLKLKKKLEDSAFAQKFSGNYSLKDAEYQVWYTDKYYDSKVKYGVYKTDANGEIDFGELPMHQAYYIQEISPSYGCRKDDTIYMVHLEDGDNDTYYYYCKYSTSTNSSGSPIWKNSEGYVADDGSTLEKSTTMVKTITVTSEEPVNEFKLKLVKESTGAGIAGTTFSRAGAIYTIYAADKPASDSNRTETLANALSGISGTTNLKKLKSANSKGKLKVLGSVKTNADGTITKVYTGEDGSGTESSGTSITLPLSDSNYAQKDGQYFYMIETTAPKGYIRSDKIFAIAAWGNSSKTVSYNVYSSNTGSSWTLLTDTTVGTIATVTAKDEQTSLKVQLIKASADPDYTSGKSTEYSLKDAEYTLYYGSNGESDQKAADGWAVKTKVATAKTGSRFTLEFANMTVIKQSQGYYYIRETKASKGFELDPTIYAVSVRAGEEPETLNYYVYASKTGNEGSFKKIQEASGVPSGTLISITSEEPPIYKPLMISLVKYDKATGSPVSVADESMSAEFQVEYYNVKPGTDIENLKADRAWRFKTDKSGSMVLSKESLGTTYKNSTVTYYDDGSILFPEGTYRLKEVTAPQGYTLENGIIRFGEGGSFSADSPVLGYDAQIGITFTIKKNEHGQLLIYYMDRTETGSEEIAVENLNLSAYDEMDQCSVKIIKYKQGTTKLLKGVTFKLVSDKGKEYIKTTNSKGTILFDGLLSGTYTLTETDGPYGMQLLKDSITIELPLTMSEDEAKNGNVDTSKAIKQIIKDENGKDLVQYVFRDITYKVGNSYNMDMPLTGGNDQLQILLGMMGLMIILLCAWKWRKTWILSK